MGDLISTSNPEDYLEKVNDEKSFVTFLAILAEDWETEQEYEMKHPSSPYSPGVCGWENGTIGAFLDAAHACATDAAEASDSEVLINPWKRAAEIIYCGKIYE